MINDFFDKVFCINLRSAVDRRAHCERLFKLLGWQVEFIDGFDSSAWPDNGLGMFPGCYGASISHAMCAARAVRDGHPNYLVFEDDLLMVRDIAERLPLFLNAVPNDWGLLYLGWIPWCQHNRTPVNSHIDRVTGMNGAHAFAVNETVYGHYLCHLLNFREHCDTCAAFVQQSCRAYAFNENLISQGGFGSLAFPVNKNIPGPEILKEYL